MLRRVERPPAKGRRGRPIAAEVAAGTTVKDLAESLGVPHTEIAVIVVNGESVDSRTNCVTATE